MELIDKKALWVIEEKMKIIDSDVIIEASMEYFPDRYAVSAKLKTRQTKKAVIQSIELAMAILSMLSKMQIRNNNDIDKTQ